MKWSLGVFVTLCLASFSIPVLGGTSCASVQADSYHYIGCNVHPASFSQLIYIYTNGVGFFVYAFDALDQTWGPAFPPQLSRGQGAVVKIADGGGHQICSAEPAQPPALPLHLVSGLNLVSCQSNIVAQFEDIVGRAPMEGAHFARFIGGSPNDPFWTYPSSPFNAPNFVTCVYTNGAWSPSVPTAAIGESVFVSEPLAFEYHPVALNPRIAGGNLAFELETVYGKSVTIEVTDALPPSLPPNWQQLTTFVGDGHRKTISDPLTNGGSNQKYYRIKSTSP